MRYIKVLALSLTLALLMLFAASLRAQEVAGVSVLLRSDAENPQELDKEAVMRAALITALNRRPNVSAASSEDLLAFIETPQTHTLETLMLIGIDGRITLSVSLFEMLELPMNVADTLVYIVTHTDNEDVQRKAAKLAEAALQVYDIGKREVHRSIYSWGPSMTAYERAEEVVRTIERAAVLPSRSVAANPN